MTENEFRDKLVRPFLESMPNLKYFVKEAASIRAIPDIIGCCKGKFFAIELKRSQKEASKTTGRIVQQAHWLKTWDKDCWANTFLVYPENFEDFKVDFRCIM